MLQMRNTILDSFSFNCLRFLSRLDVIHVQIDSEETMDGRVKYNLL